MADGIEIKLRGFDELAKQLRELPEKLAQKALDASLKEAAKPMLAAAKANAPVLAQNTVRRRAGTLRRSIRLKSFRVRGSLNRGITIGVRKLTNRQVRGNKLAAAASRRRLGVRISSNWNDPFYWYFVEHGTKKMAARHFLQRALKEHQDEFLTRFRTGLGLAIEAIWKAHGR